MTLYHGRRPALKRPRIRYDGAMLELICKRT